MKHLKKFNEDIGMGMHPNDAENLKTNVVSDSPSGNQSQEETGNLMIYHFTPTEEERYGETWTVMATSKEKALEYLLEHIKNDQYRGQYLQQWSKVNVNDPNTLPKGYTIEVYGEGEVIDGEIS